MTVILFTGPTLTAADARSVLDVEVRPPAGQGDVHRAVVDRPQVIGLIDGRFDTTPAVWHKEILWAMSQGVHVWGSASMGALRAVELAPFGMQGEGEVFRAYQRGELEDDDEVAVTHGPAETGYRALSVALVNIRATLAAAQARAVIRADTRAGLEGLAKALFYADRTYPRLLRAGAQAGLDGRDLAALRAWLPTGQVDQKRADALDMLRVIRDRLRAGLPPQRVRYYFEHTEYWDKVQRRFQP